MYLIYIRSCQHFTQKKDRCSTLSELKNGETSNGRTKFGVVYSFLKVGINERHFQVLLRK